MKKMLTFALAMIMLAAMLPTTVLAMPTVHPVVQTGVTRITLPSLEVVEVVAVRTGTAAPIVEVATIATRLGVRVNSMQSGEWNTINNIIGRVNNMTIPRNGVSIENIGTGSTGSFIEHVTVHGTGARGTQHNPFHWGDIQNMLTALDGGFRFANRVNNVYTDVWVAVSGDRFGVIEFSNNVMAGNFERITLARGEARVIRMHGASLWNQQEPITVTNFVFRTGNARQADAQRFGWVWAPDIPIEFTVPRNQGIKEIQAFDPRVGEVRVFRPGDTAYVGTDGATFWFHNPQAVSRYNTSFDRP